MRARHSWYSIASWNLADLDAIFDIKKSLQSGSQKQHCPQNSTIDVEVASNPTLWRGIVASLGKARTVLYNAGSMPVLNFWFQQVGLRCRRSANSNERLVEHGSINYVIEIFTGCPRRPS
jgi:hypothetical protein